MCKGGKSTDNIGKITIQLDDLYKSDPTLDYLKRLEEDRKALLSVHDLASAWSEPSIQERVEDMRSALGYSELQDAFKSHKDYMSVTSPLISALSEDNPHSLLEAFKLDIVPYLDPTYAQTLKATDLFSQTLQNVSHLDLPKIPNYFEDMKKTMSLYDTSLGLGNKSLVELATSLENNAFKSKFGLVGNMSTVSEALKPATSVLDSIGLQTAKTLEAFQPIKSPWLDKLTKSQEAFKMTTEPIIPKIELPEIPHYEAPRPEDSPHYKQNEKILNNSEEQIVLLNQMSVYMSSQTEKLEFLNDITVKQVEENKDAAEKGMAINAKSSRNATWIAIAGIFLTLVVSIISIWATLYVYELQKISDNQDQAEVVQLLKANNLNGSISELVNQLKIQNQNTQDISLLRKENVKLKLLLEAKQTLNKDLD